MAYNMTFLAIPDGTLAYQNRTTGGALTPAGATSYGAGTWGGVQSLVVTGGGNYFSAPIEGHVDDTSDFWAAILYVRDEDRSQPETITWFGQNVGQGHEFYIGRLRESQADLEVYAAIGNPHNARTASAGPQPALSAWSMLYFDMGPFGNQLRAGKDADALITTSARTPVGTLSGELRFGSPSDSLFGRIAAVAIGTGTLNDTERAALFNATMPWTWNMISDQPVVSIGADDGVGKNALWTRAGSFTDTDSANWTATVDYGDGSGVQSLSLLGQAFTLSHTYTAAGVYVVTVEVIDDLGSIGRDTLQITVADAPTAGVFILLAESGTDTTAPVIELPY